MDDLMVPAAELPARVVNNADCDVRATVGQAETNSPSVLPGLAHGSVVRFGHGMFRFRHASVPLPLMLPSTPQLPLPRDVQIFLHRYRRYVAPPLVALALLLLRPHVSVGDVFFDTLTDGLGCVIALAGQVLRLWAWGSNADTAATGGVRTRGPYALLRHPLYTGNLLIATGLLVVFNNPWAYVLCSVPLVLLYRTIAKLEEEHMSQTCVEYYRRYLASGIPRFLPAVRQVPAALRTSLPFRWRVAYGKEYESVLGWLAGILALRLYERVWWQGASAARREVVVLGLLLCTVGLVAIHLYIRKIRQKRRAVGTATVRARLWFMFFVIPLCLHFLRLRSGRIDG